MTPYKVCLLGVAAVITTGLQADAKPNALHQNQTKIQQQRQQELERNHTKKLYHALKTHDAALIQKVLQESPEQFELQAARVADLQDAEYAQSRTRLMVYGLGLAVLSAAVSAGVQIFLMDKVVIRLLKNETKSLLEQRAQLSSLTVMGGEDLAIPITPHPRVSQPVDPGSAEGFVQ